MRTNHFDLVLCNSEISCFGASLSRWGGGAELLALGLVLGLLLAHRTVSDPRSGRCWAQKGGVCILPETVCGETPSSLQEDVPFFCVVCFFFFNAKGFSFFLVLM